MLTTFPRPPLLLGGGEVHGLAPHQEVVLTVGADDPAHAGHVGHRRAVRGRVRRGQADHPLAVGPRAGDALQGGDESVTPVTAAVVTAAAAVVVTAAAAVVVAVVVGVGGSETSLWASAPTMARSVSDPHACTHVIITPASPCYRQVCHFDPSRVPPFPKEHGLCSRLHLQVPPPLPSLPSASLRP